MIEFRTEQRESLGATTVLYINGVKMGNSQVHFYGLGNDSVKINVRGSEAETLLHEQRIRDIPENVIRITFDVAPRVRETDLRIVPEFSRPVVDGIISMKLNFVFRVPYWKKPWSMAELSDAVRIAVGPEGAFGLHWDAERRPSMMPTFGLQPGTCSADDKLGDLVFRWIPVGQSILNEAERNLATRLKTDSLVALFDFPSEVRSTCEQYLLYFAEFLKDLGLEATADITHDAGRVLFSVTPASGAEALERLREALEIYLGLPAADSLGDMAILSRDPRVQQLLANVQHLKGQLYLANAALQFKDATIDRMNEVRMDRRPLSGEVIQNSLQVIESSVDHDEEEIVEGVVKLRKYQGKGFEINLPEIYRRFRTFLLGKPKSE